MSEHQIEPPLPERGEGGRFLPRTPVPERSEERARLGQAIEYLKGLDKQLERLAAARDKLDLRGKDRAAADARTALAEAKKRAPELLVAKMMGEAVDPAQTVDHAQGLLEDAQRQIAEATEADALLADEIQVVEQRRETAFYARDRALAEVLHSAPEVAALWDRFQAAKRLVADISWQLSAIGIHRLPAEYRWDGMLPSNDTGSGAEWKAAVARLESDADAALPGEI